MRKGFRSITVHGELWSYKVGRVWVEMRSPEDRPFRVEIYKIKGFAKPDQIEHDRAVTPAVIERYIALNCQLAKLISDAFRGYQRK